MIDISIIIINYNTKKLIIDCLDSILINLKGIYEIIVIDNDSSDGSAEMLRADYGDKIKLIINGINLGFGPANNQGAKLASGEYLLFLNSDTLIKENILNPIKKIFDGDKRIGVVGPRLYLEDQTFQPNAYGKFPRVYDLVKNKFYAREPADNGIIEVDWVSGAALAIRKDLFESIGGFDEKYFMYYEDIDLCKMVKDCGYKIMIDMDISVIHLVAKSSKNITQVKNWYYESQNYFFRKHYGFLNMLLMKIIRLPMKKSS